MAAPVILVEAQPRRPADGVAVTVRLAGGGARRAYHYLGQHWRGTVTALPTIITALDFPGGDLGTGGVPSAAEFEWAPGSGDSFDELAGYMWVDAPITLRLGAEGVDPPVLLSGKVLTATAADGRMKIALADPAAALRKPPTATRFAGTGGAEGPAAWDGQLRRRVFGRVWNQRGDPIDKANNIYCFADPARPIQAFDALRDMGADAAAIDVLAWQGSLAATFAALQAAVAPAGGGVACPSIACVKWWTTPAGDLTADLKGEVGGGYVETAAEIAGALVASIAGPVFAAGTVAAAKLLRPAPVGWTINDDSTTVAAMLDELLGDSSLLWVLDTTGEIVIREWAWGAPVATARSHGVTRQRAFAPVATRKLGYRRNELPMSRGDLAAIVLTDRVTIYNRSAVPPTLPGVTSHYDRSTGVLTGLDNGWTLAVPAGTDPLYVSAATVTGSGSVIDIPAGAWAGAVLLASPSAIPNVDTVFLYRRTATPTAPALPSADVTWTFASKTPTGMTGGWSASMPATGGLYYWSIAATALATGATDAITPAEWAQPALMSVQQQALSLNGLVPDTPGGLAALTLVRTFDSGNVTIGGTFTFTGSADPANKNCIDYFELGYYVADTSAAYTFGSDPTREVWRPIELDMALTSWTTNLLTDVAANKWYTIGIRAIRIVDRSVSATGLVKSAIRQSAAYRPAATQNYTGALGGTLASLIAAATSNFNLDNDGNGLVPPAPTAVTIGATLYPDGTCSLPVQWSYTTSTGVGDANNIDGFLVGLYPKSSPAAWTYTGGALDNVIHWVWVNANVRNFNFTAKPVQFSYWGVVFAYRRVRSDISADRIILSPVGQTTPGAPMNPASSPNFTGTISGQTASLVVIGSNRANAAIDGSNNIAANKVLQASIIAGALNESDYVSQGAVVAYGAGDVTTMGMISTVTVDSSGRLVCRFVPTFYLTKTGPVQGTTYSLDMEIILTPVGLSTVLYASPKYTVKERWDSPTVGTFQALEQRTGVIEHYFSGVAAGNYGVGYRVSLPATNGATMPAYRYMNARAPRADE